jgi:arylsulfatase A
MSSPPDRPNIVYIMADDMGYGDPGCYGATKIPTPNMDRLASEGMRFRDAHSSSAVCSPSRYSVMTGRYCWRTWMKKWVLGGFGAPLIDAGRTTVASMLKEQGYATCAVGKWHLGFDWMLKDGTRFADSSEQMDWDNDGSNVDYEHRLSRGPVDHGFDYFWGIAGSLDMQPYCFIENDHTVGIPDREKSPYTPQQRKGLMTEGWRDDEVDTTFARKATEWLENHVQSDPDQPFFLYLPTSAPHRPCVPPDFMKGRSEAGLRGDMVSLYDWVVGQVMETLEKLGVADNTLLMVTSDNGGRLINYDGNDYGHPTNANLRGQKADVWDGGHREPFIARWPGVVSAGTTCDDTICLGDLLATCSEIVGPDLPTDAGEDSFSFLPSLTGQDSTRERRPYIIHHSGDGMFSIREGKWKMCRGLGSGGFSEPKWEEPVPGGPKGQLYDMESDIAETTNLWQQRPEIVDRLSGVLEDIISNGRSRA